MKDIFNKSNYIAKDNPSSIWCVSTQGLVSVCPLHNTFTSNYSVTARRIEAAIFSIDMFV